MTDRTRSFRARGLWAAITLISIHAGAAAQELVFEPPLRTSTGASPVEVLAADVGGTSSIDAVVSPLTGSGGSPSVHLGAGDGTFGPPLALRGTADAKVEDIGDLDEDGVADLLTLRSDFGSGAAFLRIGHGDGTYEPELLIATGLNPTQALFGDFNGDDDLDVLIVRSGDVLFDQGGFSVHFGAGDGTLAVPVQFVSFGFGGLCVVGDLNGDLVDDVVAAHGNAGGGPALVDVYLGSTGGTFTKTPTCADCSIDPLLAVQDLILGDFDEDGDLDVGYSETSISGLSQPGVMEVRLNDGAGNLSTGSDAVVYSNFKRLVAGDVDGDGDDDLVGSTPTFFNGPLAGQAVPSGETKIVRMESGVGESGMPLIVTTPGTRDLALADVDGDGRLDVLTVDFLGGTLDVLLNATYRPREPFGDLGEVLAGSHGFPVQVAGGTLVPGTPFSFALHNGVPAGSAYHVVGLSRIDAPFKAGVMVPHPLIINGPLPVDGDGKLALAGTWPPGVPGGVKLYLQFWFPDAGGYAGFAATTAIEATLP